MVWLKEDTGIWTPWQAGDGKKVLIKCLARGLGQQHGRYKLEGIERGGHAYMTTQGGGGSSPKSRH